MKSVKCVEFIDRPVFEIDDKNYSVDLSVDLENSEMMRDVYKYLNSLPVKEDNFFTLSRMRVYEIPSLGKYLALTVNLDCESAEYEQLRYVVTNMGVESAFLLDVASEIEFEPMEEWN